MLPNAESRGVGLITTADSSSHSNSNIRSSQQKNHRTSTSTSTRTGATAESISNSNCNCNSNSNSSSVATDSESDHSSSNSNSKTARNTANPYRNAALSLLSYVTLCGFQNTTTTTAFDCGSGGAVVADTHDNTDTHTGTRSHTHTRTDTATVTGMRTASVSRRFDKLQSPAMRSRSTERSLKVADIPQQLEDCSDPTTDDESLNKYPQPPFPHDRATSEFFDTPSQQQEQFDAVVVLRGPETATADEPEYATIALPTLPRYPMAENRDKNCWSEPPVSIFCVRGASYFTDTLKKKVPSAAYLLRARGSDLFLTSSASSGQHEQHMAPLDQRTHTILGGQLRKKPTLAINFRFPWGYMNLYFELPKKLLVYMLQMNETTTTTDTINNTIDLDPTLTTAERTLAKWLLGNTYYKNERLKLIPYVAEGPWVVRNMVTGRPAIIGKKLPVSYQLLYDEKKKNEQPLLTATLDIGNSSATAKRIVSVCRRYMSALTVDVGFVIQAESADELPEQMMGAIRVHGPDPLKAPSL